MILKIRLAQYYSSKIAKYLLYMPDTIEFCVVVVTLNKSKCRGFINYFRNNIVVFRVFPAGLDIPNLFHFAQR